MFVRKILPLYYQSLLKAGQDSTWAQADEVLGYINIYQQKQGAAVIPPESVQKAELLYNKLKLFNRFLLPMAAGCIVSGRGDPSGV